MKIKAPYLTKSKYVKGVRCVKALYLNEYRRELAEKPDVAAQFRMEQGMEVGRLATEQFPGGVEIVRGREKGFSEELQATRKAVEKGVPAIFEATFAFNNILVKADILEKGERGWSLIEVKSSSKLEEEHIDDASVQYYVLKNCGIKRNGVFLMHINRDCVYPDLSNFFVKEDISEAVKARQKAVEDQVRREFETLGLSSEPDIDIGTYCYKHPGNKKNRECEFKPYCWKHVRAHSVFELYRMRKPKQFELYYGGTVQINALPAESYSLNTIQQIQVNAVRSGEPYVDRKGIGEFLAKIEYPICYLDFETASPAIPLFDGMHPYEHIPFQFSCHVKDKDGNLNHHEFIELGKKDHRKGFVEALLKAVGNQGSIVVYTAFESGKLSALANVFPEYSAQIEAIQERLVDLKKVFPKHYYHPDFHGSASIKKVLPALCSGFSYDGMAIKGGEEAGTAYLNIQKGNVSENEVATIEKNLREYCQMDTKAMIEIHQILEKLVK